MEFKVIMYVLIGIGYVVYNLYKKLNVPPPSKKEQDYSDSDEIEREVKAPVFKSAQEIIEEIRQQNKSASGTSTPEEKAVKERQPPVFDEGVQNGEEETAKLLKEQERLLAIANREGRGKKEKTNHLDSIHLFDYDKDKKLSRKKRKIDLKQAMIYDVVFNRPRY